MRQVSRKEMVSSIAKIYKESVSFYCLGLKELVTIGKNPEINSAFIYVNGKYSYRIYIDGRLVFKDGKLAKIVDKEDCGLDYGLDYESCVKLLEEFMLFLWGSKKLDGTCSEFLKFKFNKVNNLK